MHSILTYVVVAVIFYFIGRSIGRKQERTRYGTSEGPLNPDSLTLESARDQIASLEGQLSAYKKILADVSSETPSWQAQAPLFALAFLSMSRENIARVQEKVNHLLNVVCETRAEASGKWQASLSESEKRAVVKLNETLMARVEEVEGLVNQGRPLVPQAMRIYSEYLTLRQRQGKSLFIEEPCPEINQQVLALGEQVGPLVEKIRNVLTDTFEQLRSLPETTRLLQGTGRSA
jgi:hypothetical protein